MPKHTWQLKTFVQSFIMHKSYFMPRLASLNCNRHRSTSVHIYADWQCISINNGSVNSGIVSNGKARNLSRGAVLCDKEQAWENVTGVGLSTQTRGRGSRLVSSYGIPGNFRTLLHTFMLTEPHYWHSFKPSAPWRLSPRYDPRLFKRLWKLI